VASAFGVAQGVAPLLGYGLGAAFAGVLAAYDHWVAFAILAVLGAKMIKEGLTDGPEDIVPRTPDTGLALLAIAFATSIDAAAAGIALPALGIHFVIACFVIMCVTFAVCYLGVFLGRALGAKLGGAAEVLGGLALIGIGAKVLVDHGAFG
jgi:putative Mn2+ efflux pump MntP